MDSETFLWRLFRFILEREMFGPKGIFKTADARADAKYIATIDCIICEVVPQFNIA